MKRQKPIVSRELVTAVIVILGVLVALGAVTAATRSTTPMMSGGMNGMAQMMQGMGGHMGEMNEHMEDCHKAMASGDTGKMMDVMKKHMSDPDHMKSMGQMMSGFDSSTTADE